MAIADPFINSAKSLLGGSTPKEGFYTPNPLNWFEALPYGFKHTDRDGNSKTMFLPINPSNLNVVTHYATNVIPTLYGTVEEHSEVRYFDITIEGTTGIAPKWPQEFSASKNPTAIKKNIKLGDSRRRASFSVNQPILGGFFQKTIGKVNSVINKATDVVNSAKSIFGVSNEPETGVNINNTGYMAFHNLYLFLIKYKRDAAGLDSSKIRKQHPLTFLNYKDNVRYDVAVQNFVLKRSADNPMLYNYSITMRAYNMQSIFGSPTELGDLKTRLNELGLGGDSTSAFNKMKNLSKNVKGLVGASKGVGGLF